MSTPKLLVIIGATGTQGSSVISHFLQHNRGYQLRGTTRNTSSPKAQALSARGVEMVQADVDDATALAAAFAGAHAIFAYTDYAGFTQGPAAGALVAQGEAHDIAEAAGMLERRAGANIAAAAAGVSTLERLVWSSCQDAERWSKGVISGVYEMQAKAWVLEHMFALEGLRGKVSCVAFGAFVETLVRFPEAVGWAKRADGAYVLRVPVSSFTWIAMEQDAGSWVEALLPAPAGTCVEAATERLSFGEVAEVLSGKLGAPVVVERVPVEEYSAGDESGVFKQTAMLFRWVEEFGIAGGDPRYLTAEELTKRGYSVKQTSIKAALEQMDLSVLV